MNSFRKLPGLLCLAGMLLSASAYRSAAAAVEPQADDAAAAEVVRVRTVAVTQQQLSREVTQPASILPFYQAHLRARATGYVTQVHADLGDVVKQGTVLAVIAAPELEQKSRTLSARIRRLKAEEARAAAGLDVARAHIAAAQADQHQMEAQVTMKEADLRAATSEFERMQDLVNRGASEPRLLDETVRRRESAQAGRSTSQSAVVAAQAAVKVSQARMAAAEADMEVAQAETQTGEAELQELQVMLGYLELTAPFDGVVTQRTVNPGDLVDGTAGAATAHPLFIVSQLATVRCRIDVSERDAAFVRKGDRVVLTLPSFPDERFESTVARTGQSLNPETRTMTVEADIPNADGRLLAGMFGQATLSISSPKTASLLPAGAVRFDAQGKAIVYTIDSRNRVAIASVKIVGDDGQWLQIDGVQPGQRVIDAHLRRFAEGQQVQVLETVN